MDETLANLIGATPAAAQLVCLWMVLNFLRPVVERHQQHQELLQKELRALGRTLDSLADRVDGQAVAVNGLTDRVGAHSSHVKKLPPQIAGLERHIERVVARRVISEAETEATKD